MSQTAVVTPEGVLLDYRPAGVATRTMGRLIDLALQLTIGYIALVVLALTLVQGAVTPVIIVAIASAFLLLFGYPVAFEVFGGGRTPGHRATGTRVICLDGGPVRFRHAAIRSMLFLVDGLATFGFGGAVSVLVTARGQRLGDLAAGTMVVRLDRPHAERSAPVTVSLDLAARAQRFDRRLVPADELATARLLLERGGSLRPGAQLALAERVAQRLDAHLGGVRGDVPPAAFVAVVVAPPPVEPPPAAETDAEVPPAVTDREEAEGDDGPEPRRTSDPPPDQATEGGVGGFVAPD